MNFQKHRGCLFLNFLLKAICFQILVSLVLKFFMIYYRFYYLEKAKIFNFFESEIKKKLSLYDFGLI